MVDVKWVSVVSANLVPVTRFAVITGGRCMGGVGVFPVTGFGDFIKCAENS